MNKIASIRQERDDAMKMARVYENLIRLEIAVDENTRLLSSAISEVIAYEKVLDILQSIECPICKLQFTGKDADYINKEGHCLTCGHNSQEEFIGYC
jgi:hypothetical protein